MDIKQLDFYFPFVVLVYGLTMTIVLSSPKLKTVARENLSRDQFQQFFLKKPVALVCLGVGALWSLQNIWLS